MRVKDMFSNCCNAPATHPGYPDSDVCSECKEHTDFDEREILYCDKCNSRINENNDYGFSVDGEALCEECCKQVVDEGELENKAIKNLEKQWVDTAGEDLNG